MPTSDEITLKKQTAAQVSVKNGNSASSLILFPLTHFPSALPKKETLGALAERLLIYWRRTAGEDASKQALMVTPLHGVQSSFYWSINHNY